MAVAGGCSEEAKIEATSLVIDLAACLETARETDCGDVFREGGMEGMQACLLLTSGADQAVFRFLFDAEGASLSADGSEGEVTVSTGAFIDSELLILRPDAAGCPPPSPGQGCDDVAGCVLSFGEEQVEIGDSAVIEVRYGGESGLGCAVQCSRDCPAETCDAADEDCDGEVDEDLEPPANVECLALGVCAGITPACAGEEGWRCDYPEAYEADVETLCDGLDNDCDGTVDEPDDLQEGGLVGVACGEAEGQCAAGLTLCRAGEVVCEGMVLGTEELCDGLDNDCDGATDEAFALRIDAADPVAQGGDCDGAGLCGQGVVVCTREADAACCSTSPGCRDVGTEEVCDGLDNDCDGATDGDVTPTEEDACINVGVCRGTNPRCAGEAGWACDYPDTWQDGRERLCDGLDNDCDGDVDDRDDLFFFEVIGARCGDNTGRCEFGTVACVAGRQRCPDAVAAIPETCDGIDEDCDGETDEAEDLLAAGIIGDACGDTDVGLCERGSRVCDRGQIVCDGLVEPADEVCDGLDNDCNGEVDESYRDLGADSLGMPCGDDEGDDCGGTMICSQLGERTCCSTDEDCNPEFDPNEEICDARDNDCDGATDENFEIGLFCEGVGECPPGRLECAGPGETRCETSPNGTDYAGRAETCDNLDNDCDGATDENFEIAGVDVGGACLGVGACPDGLVECSDDGARSLCSTNPGGSTYVEVAETCDRLDNDCDAATDENFDWLGTAVGDGCQGVGECGEGLVECVDAATTTCSTNPDGQFRQDLPEDCDGADNDCDGATDEAEDLALVPHSCDVQDGVCEGAIKACGGQAGWLDCDGARFLANDVRYEAVEASCDDVDNDCNGATDEAFVTKGDVCDEGDGACNVEGELICNVAGDGTMCDAVEGDPSDEECDGIDNDCDGQTDEIAELDPPLCANQQGVCGGAEKVCGGEEFWLACGEAQFVANSEDYEAAESSCDALDNDCDDDTDEADGVGAGDACVRASCPGGTAGKFWCGDGQGGGQCDPGVLIKTVEDVGCHTFSRSTTATFVADAAGTVSYAAVDEPRFQYDDDADGTYLLLEGARTNLLYDTATPSPPAWSLFTYVGDDTTIEELAEGGPDLGAFTRVSAPGNSGGIRLDQNNLVDLDEPLAYSLWLRSDAGGPVALNDPLVPWSVEADWIRFAYLGSSGLSKLRFLLVRLDRGGDPATRFDVWGPQVERGSFGSSYIPRALAEDSGDRAADSLTVAPEFIDPARGTYAGWFAFPYEAAEDVGDRAMLSADSAASVRLDGTGENPAFECTAGDATARSDVSFPAGRWVFVACTWDEGSGVRLHHRVADDLTTVSADGAFAAGVAPVAPFSVAPTWVLVGETRLYRRALDDGEVAGLADAGAAEFR